MRRSISVAFLEKREKFTPSGRQRGPRGRAVPGDASYGAGIVIEV